MKKLLLLVSVLLLSSCTKFVHWGKKHLDQGCELNTFTCVPREHIVTTRIYNQVLTDLIVDGMWLSDCVRRAYVDLHAQKFFLSPQQKEIMLSDELSKNKKTIGFYLLVWQTASCGGNIDKKKPYWHVVLTTDYGSYAPKLVKKIDLPCEYELFFAKQMNNFKKSFYIEFDVLDKDGTHILQQATHLTLCFTSFNKNTYITWHVQDGQLVCVDTSSCAELEECGACNDLTLR